MIANSGNVAPKEVREELWRCLKDKKKQERKTFHKMRQHLLEDYGDSDEERTKKVMCSHFLFMDSIFNTFIMRHPFLDYQIHQIGIIF